MDLSLPTIDVSLIAASLGIFLLKGIQGNHSLCQIMPQELQTLLHQSGRRAIARKLQRGKATCVEPPKPSQQPWTPQVTLLDIFSLPMAPGPAEGSRPDQLPRDLSNRHRSTDSQPEGLALTADVSPEVSTGDKGLLCRSSQAERAAQRTSDHCHLRPAELDRDRSGLSQPPAAFSIENPLVHAMEGRSQPSQPGVCPGGQALFDERMDAQLSHALLNPDGWQV